MGTQNDSLTPEPEGNIIHQKAKLLHLIFPLWARSSAAERAAHNRLVVGSNPAEPTKPW